MLFPSTRTTWLWELQWAAMGLLLFLQLDLPHSWKICRLISLHSYPPRLVSRAQVPEMYTEEPLSATTIKVSEVT